MTLTWTGEKRGLLSSRKTLKKKKREPIEGLHRGWGAIQESGRREDKWRKGKPENKKTPANSSTAPKRRKKKNVAEKTRGEMSPLSCGSSEQWKRNNERKAKKKVKEKHV